ncbi:prepilin peptidase [Roseburia hominis]
MRVIGEAVFLVMLAVGAFWDVRSRKVPVVYLIFFTLAVVLYQMIWFRQRWMLWVLGMSVGVCFLMLSRLSGEGISYGDSWMILNLGMLLGIWKVFAVLAGAFVLMLVAALIGVKIRKWGRKTRIPFLPFLLAGYVGALLC